jgi:hypothetical protein
MPHDRCKKHVRASQKRLLKPQNDSEALLNLFAEELRVQVRLVPSFVLPARSFSIFVPWLHFSCACSRYSYSCSQFFVPSFPFVVRTVSMSPPRSAAIKQKCLIVPPCSRSLSTAALRCVSRCCALHSARCLLRVARCILRAACCAHSDSRPTQSAFACVVDRSSRARPPPHVRRMTSCTRRRRYGRGLRPLCAHVCGRVCAHVRACVRACACVCDRVCARCALL